MPCPGSVQRRHFEISWRRLWLQPSCSLVPMVNANGPVMDRAETVTTFNDLCVLAPASLIDAPITWQPWDGHHVRALFTNGAHIVTAELFDNEDNDLVDFVSDDRLRASQTARRFHPPAMVHPSIQDHRREPDDNAGRVTLHTGVSRKPLTGSWLYR